MRHTLVLLAFVLLVKSAFASYPGETPTYNTVQGGNIRLQSNSVISTDTNGDITLNPNGTGKVNVPYATASQPALFDSSKNLVSGQIDLTTNVSGVLPLANGGTNKNMTASNGAVVYSDGDSMELLAPGTSGQVLKTNGAGAAPEWITVSGSVDANLAAAASATTFFTDQYGNTFSRWDGYPLGRVIESYCYTTSASAGCNYTSVNNMSDVYAVAMSPDMKYLFVGANWVSGTNSFKAFKRNGDSFTQLPMPTNIANDCAGVDSLPTDSSHVVCARSGSPFYNVYKMNGADLTSLTTPLDTAPTAAASAARYNHDGSILCLGHTFSTRSLSCYTRSGDAYTKISDANFSVLPTAKVNGICWSSDGAYMSIVQSAASTGASAGLITYYVSGTTFTKLADPATLPTGNSTSCDWSKDGTYLAMTGTTAPSVYFYKKSGTTSSATLAKLSDPATLPTASLITLIKGAVAWHPSGNYAVVTQDSSTLPILAYDRSGDTLTYKDVRNFQTTLDIAPSTNALEFSTNGEYMIVGGFSFDQLFIYKTDRRPPLDIKILASP